MGFAEQSAFRQGVVDKNATKDNFEGLSAQPHTEASQ